MRQLLKKNFIRIFGFWALVCGALLSFSVSAFAADKWIPFSDQGVYYGVVAFDSDIEFVGMDFHTLLDEQFKGTLLIYDTTTMVISKQMSFWGFSSDTKLVLSLEDGSHYTYPIKKFSQQLVFGGVSKQTIFYVERLDVIPEELSKERLVNVMKNFWKQVARRSGKAIGRSVSMIVQLIAGLLAVIVFIISATTALVAYIWLTIVAVRESYLWGAVCVAFWPAYAFSHFQKVKILTIVLSTCAVLNLIIAGVFILLG